MVQELNYKIDLIHSTEWWRYFGEYQHYVDFTFRELKGGQITSLSLPFAFIIRHTLELGYKMNLIEFDKISGQKASIKYSGKSAHKIDDLHKEFEVQIDLIFKKFQFKKEVVSDFRKLNESLKKFKTTMHKLDTLSYAFRYPVQNDGITPSFTSGMSINFKQIKELYDNSIVLLKYTTDVIEEEIGKERIKSKIARKPNTVYTK